MPRKKGAPRNWSQKKYKRRVKKLVYKAGIPFISPSCHPDDAERLRQNLKDIAEAANVVDVPHYPFDVPRHERGVFPSKTLLITYIFQFGQIFETVGDLLVHTRQLLLAYRQNKYPVADSLWNVSFLLTLIDKRGTRGGRKKWISIKPWGSTLEETAEIVTQGHQLADQCGKGMSDMLRQIALHSQLFCIREPEKTESKHVCNIDTVATLEALEANLLELTRVEIPYPHCFLFSILLDRAFYGKPRQEWVDHPELPPRKIKET